MLYHAGQQLIFSLGRTENTVLGLVLAAQYRPLIFTSSPVAAPSALRAVPSQLLAKQVAQELGYNLAASRLSEALHGFETDPAVLTTLMNQCIHWIRLSVSHELVSNAGADKVLTTSTVDDTSADAG